METPRAPFQNLGSRPPTAPGLTPMVYRVSSDLRCLALCSLHCASLSNGALWPTFSPLSLQRWFYLMRARPSNSIGLSRPWVSTWNCSLYHEICPVPSSNSIGPSCREGLCWERLWIHWSVAI